MSELRLVLWDIGFGVKSTSNSAEKFFKELINNKENEEIDLSCDKILVFNMLDVVPFGCYSHLFDLINEKSTIKKINLDNNNVTISLIEKFKKLLTTKSVKFISLRRCGINNDVLSYLLKTLGNNNNLLYLDLRENYMNPNCLIDIFKWIKNNNSITDFDLTDNKLICWHGQTVLYHRKLKLKNEVIMSILLEMHFGKGNSIFSKIFITYDVVKIIFEYAGLRYTQKIGSTEYSDHYCDTPPYECKICMFYKLGGQVTKKIKVEE